MTTLVINGQKVTVSDDFLKLSPEQQNATVDEIAKSLGATAAPEPLKRVIPSPQTLDAYNTFTAKPPAPEMGIGERVADVAMAGGTGLGQGAMELAGLPGTAPDIAEMGARKIAGLLGMDTSKVPEGYVAAMLPGGMSWPSGSEIRSVVSDLTGGLSEYDPKTTTGEFAQVIGQYMGGGLSPKVAAAAGLLSEGAGQATEGTAWEPYARFAAGLLGPSALSMVGNAAKRVVSPMGGADPARLAMADELVAAGVPVSAGQKTGSDWLRRLEAQTSKGASMADDQIEALTSAALKTAGINATRATADVLDDAFKRIGKDFDDATKGIDVAPDPSVVNRMASAANEFKLLAPKDAAGIFGNISKEMAKAFRAGNTISGSTITTWRSSVGKLLKSADAATREAAKETVAILDDALSSALDAAGRADDVAKLATARGEYRNLLAITDAVGGSSEKAALGLLTAEMLPSAVKRQGKKAYVTGGRGEIGDLARAAQGVMRRPSSSGTVENLAAMMKPAAMPIGAIGGGLVGGPIGAGIGAAMAMSPALLRRLAVSGAGQSYLGNQLLGAASPIATKANTFGLAQRLPGLLAQ